MHLIELYVRNSTLKQRSDLLRNNIIETWLQNLNIFQHLRYYNIDYPNTRAENEFQVTRIARKPHHTYTTRSMTESIIMALMAREKLDDSK